jgi:hypothetical protein
MFSGLPSTALKGLLEIDLNLLSSAMFNKNYARSLIFNELMELNLQTMSLVLSKFLQEIFSVWKRKQTSYWSITVFSQFAS